jgi:superfamily II DNA or RNA helicase
MKSITLHVGNVFTQVDGIRQRTPIFREIEKRLSYGIPGAWFSPAYRKKFWDGKGHLLEDDIFPTGVLPFVIEILKKFKTTYEIVDGRKFPEIGEDFELDGKKLYPYQKMAVAKMLRERRGVVQIPTGGGKTLIAASVIKALDVPTLYIVHTRTLLYQTYEELHKYLPHVSMVGGGKYEFNKVTVALVQSLMRLIAKKQTKLFEFYKLLICDEAHHLMSPKQSSWYVVSTYFENASYRFGMTATAHGRKSGMLLQAATGPIIVRIPVKVLQENKFISESRILFFKVSEPKLPLNYDYIQAYEEGVLQNSIRNMIGLRKAVEHAEKGQLIMMFVDRIEHGEQLITELQSILSKDKPVDYRFLSGEDESEYINDVKNRAKNREVQILIVTRKLFGEGVDIPAVDVLINLAGGKSMIVFTQMFGRGLRRSQGKQYLQYYDFEDDTHRYLRLHSKARMTYCRKMKQTVAVEVVNVGKFLQDTGAVKKRGVESGTAKSHRYRSAV